MKTINRAAPITVETYAKPDRGARFARRAIFAAVLVFLIIWSTAA